MTPSISIFDMTIVEPMTMITDFIITAVAWWLGMKLAFAGDKPALLCRRLWALGFLFIGLGALLGGTSHGFTLYLGDTANLVVWKGTVYCVGLSMLFAVSGTAEGSRLQAFYRYLLHTLNLLGFAVYALWMIGHSDFLYVIYHYVPAMLLIACIQAWALLRHRARSAPWLIAGVITTLIGAAIQQSELRLHLHFNHNDLYHVVQIAGLFLLYRGASELPG